MSDNNETVVQVCEMSLDDAVAHATEAGERLVQDGCESCGREHLQLAAWLRELKDCRCSIAAKDAEIASLRQLVKELADALLSFLAILRTPCSIKQCREECSVKCHEMSALVAKARRILAKLTGGGK